MVGIGMGKAAEVPEAIKKATAAAKNSMVKISMVDGLICSRRSPSSCIFL